jgi:hypothetical protein
MSFENRRTQSTAGEKEILTAVAFSSVKKTRNAKGWARSPCNRGGFDMALTQGNFQDYDFDRMVVRFTMKNDQADIACAISTDAMDQLDGSSRTPPAQREQQFFRLRDRIEARAARKFSDVELEGNPPGVILRAIDFRPPR